MAGLCSVPNNCDDGERSFGAEPGRTTSEAWDRPLAVNHHEHCHTITSYREYVQTTSARHLLVWSAAQG